SDYCQPKPIVLPAVDRWRFWRWPVVSAAVVFSAILAAYVYWWPSSSEQRASQPIDEFFHHWENGQRALAQGSFLQAGQDLQSAFELRPKDGKRSTVPSNRELIQCHRQAMLLSQLASESLADILKQAIETYAADEREWQALFERRYRDQAVVFDAT